MKEMPDNSVDSIVTDPPYELGFMGKSWDSSGIAFNIEVWQEALRVLKPGGHLLAFSGSRTYHRMAVAIEDAGFEIRDQIMWVYGSGFPKSHNISKGIDKNNGETDRLIRFTLWMRTTGLKVKDVTQVLVENDLIGENGTIAGHYFAMKSTSQPAIPTVSMWKVIRPLITDVPEWVDELVDRIEAEREVVGKYETDMGGFGGERLGNAGGEITTASTAAAKQWDGWGTALKPAHEPIVLARKPLGVPELDVFQAIVYYLENNVLKGKTKWIQESVKPVANKKNTTSSLLTKPLKVGETFVNPAATLESEGQENEILKSQNLLTKDGKSEIQTSLKNLERSSDCNCDQKSCKHTETSAFAAQNLLSNSSPLITLMVAGENTEKPQVMFTQKSVKLDSRLTIESCVGTATPHSEFTAFVLTVICNGETYELSNNNKGLWTWPSDLPKNLPAQTMTVANNVLTYGTGGLNIDGSRVISDDWDAKTVLGKYVGNNANNDSVTNNFGVKEIKSTNTKSTLIGRWPANFIHDGSDEVVDLLGEPARFFYCAKASKRDRNEGLEGFEEIQLTGGGGLTAVGGAYGSIKAKKANHHPTVKPTDLMRYLCRLITPPNGTVLDPFMGSGSTGKACAYEGFDFIGIDQSAEYVEIARARIEYAQKQGKDYLL